MNNKAFSVLGSDGNARVGQLTLANGTVSTPAFMPVGTAATVKGMKTETLEDIGAEILLSNVYHLMLRPGSSQIQTLGGLHKFMNWSRPILTDSGGFQVMSLSGIRKIREDGVEFRSHIDGTKYLLTPELAIDMQLELGSDISMVLDECTPYPSSKDQAELAMRRSMRWAKTCRERFLQRPGYLLFGIVQGGMYPELRHDSIEALKGIGFDGYAIGGLAVGEGQQNMLDILDILKGVMPVSYPRYLMGVGTPVDIVKSVARGIDMFDCVLPTRSGRTGRAYTSEGILNIRNACHSSSSRPLDSGCLCSVCRSYSVAYLHHLFRCNEMLGPILLTHHNVSFYQKLMIDIRKAIRNKTFNTFANNFIGK